MSAGSASDGQGDERVSAGSAFDCRGYEWVSAGSAGRRSAMGQCRIGRVDGRQ